jgi:hypothetical protein
MEGPWGKMNESTVTKPIMSRKQAVCSDTGCTTPARYGMQGRCWKHASAGVKAPVKATAKALLAFNLCSETGCTTLAHSSMEGHCGKHASAEVKAKVKAKAKAKKEAAKVRAGSE